MPYVDYLHFGHYAMWRLQAACNHLRWRCEHDVCLAAPSATGKLVPVYCRNFQTSIVHPVPTARAEASGPASQYHALLAEGRLRTGDAKQVRLFHRWQAARAETGSLMFTIRFSLNLFIFRRSCSTCHPMRTCLPYITFFDIDNRNKQFQNRLLLLSKEWKPGPLLSLIGTVTLVAFVHL